MALISTLEQLHQSEDIAQKRLEGVLAGPLFRHPWVEACVRSFHVYITPGQMLPVIVAFHTALHDSYTQFQTTCATRIKEREVAAASFTTKAIMISYIYGALPFSILPDALQDDVKRLTNDILKLSSDSSIRNPHRTWHDQFLRAGAIRVH